MSRPSGLSNLEQPKLNSESTKKRFNDEVVIVTGGAGGIGSAIVHRFLNDGAKVAVADINKEAFEFAVIEQLADPALREKVRFYHVDVSDQKCCFEAVDQIEADIGNVSHLVNSVAYFGSESLNSSKEDWEKTMSVNVMGNVFMTQAVVKHMKTRPQNYKSITHISSISAHQCQPNRWTYAASKGAINILTKNMALDLAKFNIRVNSVSPGWIWSPEVSKAANGNREKWEPVWGKFHISGRLGEMCEVAGAVTFLASRDAAFVNATDLKVDGGYGAMSAEGHGESSSFAGCSE